MKIGLCLSVLILTGTVQALAADACSLLTSAEVEAALRAKVTKAIPSSTGEETGCIFQLGTDQVIVSYFTDPAKGPNVKSIKEDPFMQGVPRSNIKDYGNFGCKWADVQILFVTNCNRYQPRWLHMSVQIHETNSRVATDVVKGLLERAASRFK